MVSKKMKRNLGVFCAVTGLVTGSMTALAGSYVQSNMPGYDISCWGSIGFSGQTIRATTSSNKSVGGYSTSVAGELARNGVSLGSQSSSGTSSASITNSRANGYKYGRGTHRAYYRDATWTQSTDM